MSNTANNAASDQDSIAKQLAERRARLQQQRANSNSNVNVNADVDNNNASPAPSSQQPQQVSNASVREAEYTQFPDGMSDFEIAMRLQQQYDALAHHDEDDNHNHNQPLAQQPSADNADDSDIEMLSSPPNNNNNSNNDNTQAAAERLIDEDHEIALQLQRQFDQEDSTVPPPNTHAPPQAAMPSIHAFPGTGTGNNFFSSFSSSSNGNDGAATHTISFTTTGPDGTVRTIRHNSNDGQIPPELAALMGGHLNFNNNNNNNHNDNHGDHDDPFSVFNTHPFFARGRNNNMNNNNNNGDAFGGMPMNMNMMMINNFAPMMGGAMGMGGIGGLEEFLQMIHPRPRVADQELIEQNTATETFHAKPKKTAQDQETQEAEKKEADAMDEEEEEEEQERDPSQTCSICLEAFKDGDEVRRLPCLHFFHKHEIDRWLKTGNDKCPICRVPINGQMESN